MSIKKKVLVLGMAKSGYEAAKLLINKDYEVIVNDFKAEQNKDHIKELKDLGVSVILGYHPSNLVDKTLEMIVKNPGIVNSHIYVKKAKELNIPVINELELAFSYIPESVNIIGITGTNGKTTTSAILYELIKEQYNRAFLMGNIGEPVCSFVNELKGNDIAVIEISDHQLCNMSNFKTDISVLTNIYEAHIDFHGSYEVYKNIKKRIFNNHSSSDIAILNYDNKESLGLTNNIKSIKKYFSYDNNSADCYVINNCINYKGNKVIAINEIKLKGKHNYENIMAAIMVAKEFNIKNDAIVNVLKRFGGFEHRIEYVKSINNIEFYNDSKATNIKSTQTALASFSQPTLLLLGGLDRGHSFAELKSYLANVKHILAFGEVKNRVKQFATEANIACTAVDNLQQATTCAYELACSGDVILLSPACASWDQFNSFEERGNLFKQCVNKLS